MILEAILHSLNTVRELGWTKLPMCKQNACRMGFEKFCKNYVLETSSVDGAMFSKASLRGVKRKRGVGVGGGQAPLLQTQRLYHGL